MEKLITFSDKSIVILIPKGELRIEDSHEPGFYKATIKQRIDVYTDTPPPNNIVVKENEKVILFNDLQSLMTALGTLQYTAGSSVEKIAKIIGSLISYK